MLSERDANYWRSCARELRTFGDSSTDPTGKGTLIEIANDYENLALRAEARKRKANSTDTSISDNHPR